MPSFSALQYPERRREDDSMVRIITETRAYEFPEHFHYDVDNQVWYEALADGTVRVGFTPLSIELAGTVLAFSPKRQGRDFEAQRAFATIECGKWVGAARSAFDGRVVEGNERLVERPKLLNDDAFGAGWMLIVQPAHDTWRAALVTGAAIAPAFAAWLDAEGYKGRTE